MSIWGSVKDYVKTKVMSEANVKEHLHSKIKDHFTSAHTNLMTAKKSFANDKQLSVLCDSCDAISIQAKQLEAFVLQDLQLDVIAHVFYSKAKEYASIDTLKSTLEKSPAVSKMKSLLIDLISAQLYDGLIPLAENMGNFDKLSLAQQQSIVTLLQNDKVMSKIKSIDVKETFNSLKAAVDSLALELKLDKKDHESLKRIIETIEKNHLNSLDKIKKDIVKHINPMMNKLLETIFDKCPELAALEEKRVVVGGHTKATERKFGAKRQVDLKVSNDVVKKGVKKAKK